MSIIFVGSTGDCAGHSLFTWAIARRLKERGLRVGFVKPFGTHPFPMDGLWADRDALLFKRVLNLPESLDRICPYPMTDRGWREARPSEILEGLKTLLADLSAGRDVLLVMGSRHIFFDDATGPLPETSFIPELGADSILIHRYRTVSKSVYSILSICSLLKDRVKGIIFNRVPIKDMERIKDLVLPSLASKGAPVINALPEDPSLSFRSLREVGELLGGELIGDEKSIEQPVGGMTVGSADLEGDLLFLKRAYNKIVLLSPSSSEAGSEKPLPRRPVAGIIMTGGRRISPQMLQAAQRASVPVMMINEDTFSALERLEQSNSNLSSMDEIKVQRFSELMDRNSTFDRLFESLKLLI